VKKVYTGQHPMQAHLVKGLLEESGIEARVVGEEIFGVRGEVGFDFETAPAVFVHDEDAERALEVIRSQEARVRAAAEGDDEEA